MRRLVDLPFVRRRDQQQAARRQRARDLRQRARPARADARWSRCVAPRRTPPRETAAPSDRRPRPAGCSPMPHLPPPDRRRSIAGARSDARYCPSPDPASSTRAPPASPRGEGRDGILDLHLEIQNVPPQGTRQAVGEPGIRSSSGPRLDHDRRTRTKCRLRRRERNGRHYQREVRQILRQARDRPAHRIERGAGCSPTRPESRNVIGAAPRS